jgi:TetR/AcrR family tetracycline transcriptional repressor
MSESKLKVVATASGGRPAKISRERILQEARQLGAGELSFARIAERLGVRQQALYYHFDSREDLLQALAVDLAREFNPQPGDPKRWRAWLEETGLRFYDVLISNPVVLETSNWRGLAMFGLPLLEAALETLEGAGHSPKDAGRAWDVVADLAYVEARTLVEARKVGPMPARFDLDEMAGRPTPLTRAYYAQIEKDPRKRFTETLQWLVAALPRPQK